MKFEAGGEEVEGGQVGASDFAGPVEDVGGDLGVEGDFDKGLAEGGVDVDDVDEHAGLGVERAGEGEPEAEGDMGQVGSGGAAERQVPGGGIQGKIQSSGQFDHS